MRLESGFARFFAGLSVFSPPPSHAGSASAMPGNFLARLGALRLALALGCPDGLATGASSHHFSP
jgi:hypothetical protein